MSYSKPYYILLFILLAFVALVAKAQLPHDFRSEQVLLCPDSQYYQAGDTIWLQGVVTCNSTTDFLPYSRYVTVELVTPDTAIARLETELDSLGRFSTLLPIDSLLHEGNYALRAYTELMRNFSPKNFAFQPITIAENYPDKDRDIDDTIICRAFPWGGSLASGMVQHITVWLCDRSGIALPGIELALKDGDGSTIDLRTTSANVFAVFSFAPERDAEYSVYSTRSYSTVPLAKVQTDDSKPKIQCFLQERKVSFTISNESALPQGYRIYGYDCKNGLSQVDAKTNRGAFLLQSKPSLFTIFLTDSLNRVLSQSSAFGVTKLQCSVTTPDVVALGDSIFPVIEGLPEHATIVTRLMTGNISMVGDAASAINIASQVTSPIPMPSNYVSYRNGEKFFNDVTAWLATATFSRFDLPDAIERDSLIYSHMPKLQMSFSGNAYLNSGYSLANGTLVAYNTETNEVSNTSFKKNGDFDLILNNYYGNTRFYFQAADKKELAVKAVFQFPDKTYPSVTLPEQLLFVVNDSTLNIEDSSLKLPELTVKAYVKKEANIPTNKFYSVRYKDREEIERRHYLTLRHVLQNIIGIKVEQKGVFSTRGASTLHGGSRVPIFVDNVQYGADMVDEIESLFEMPTEEIESVEYMPPWKALAYSWNSFNGLVLVKTRNSKIKPAETMGSFFTFEGLAPTLGFAPAVAKNAGKQTLVVDFISPQGTDTFYKEILVTDNK